MGAGPARPADRPRPPARRRRARGRAGTARRCVFGTPAPDVEPVRLVLHRSLALQAGPDRRGRSGRSTSSCGPATRCAASTRSASGGASRTGAGRCGPAPGNHRDAVLNRHLVDWTSRRVGPRAHLGAGPDLRGRRPHHRLRRVARRGAGRRGSRTSSRQRLRPPRSPAASTPSRRTTGWRVGGAQSEVNHGFGLGSNLALAASTGDTVVFLNNDTEVRETGSVRSALRWATTTSWARSRCCSTRRDGAVRRPRFPERGVLPSHFLTTTRPTMRPARGVPFDAVTGAALALRARTPLSSVVSTPFLPTGWRTSTFAYGSGSGAPAISGSSPSPGRAPRVAHARAATTSPWSTARSTSTVGGHRPPDDVACGRRAAAASSTTTSAGPARRQPRVRVPQQVLVRRGHAALRWALKNPTRAGGEATLGRPPLRRRPGWGTACLGQEVVVDRRPEWTGRRPPRRRRARAARPGPPHPARQYVAAVGHLPPSEVTAEEARGYDGCSPPRPPGRRRGATAPDRAAAAGHRPRRASAPMPAAREGRAGAVRRQLAPRAAPGRPGRGRGRPPGRGVRQVWSGLAPRARRGANMPNDELAAAYALRRRRPQRPLGGHAPRRVRLQPALRRRGLRGPRDHDDVAGLASCSGRRYRSTRPPTTWPGCARCPTRRRVRPPRSARPGPSGCAASTRSRFAPPGWSRSRAARAAAGSLAVAGQVGREQLHTARPGPAPGSARGQRSSPGVS